MTMRATAVVAMKEWEENTLTEVEDGGKLTRASVKQGFAGDIDGDGAAEWLMCYRPDATADFVGVQRVVGQIGERSGSFVLFHTAGSFDGKEARAELCVVPGSGTGDLRGIRGSGAFSAPHGCEASLTLEYEFAS